uniref:Uncharacterized protein n=1 Tax=Cyclopterus lumpus TaxID=8103 RepID=A0A8C2XLR3_CYCLU
MPICWVMWSQVPGVRTRSAMVFTFSGELRVLLTMRAPWDGGLDHVVLTIFSIWDRMRDKFSPSWATTVRLPTLSSGEIKKDIITITISKPSETKYRMAQASLSRSPEAKPW